jgi:hypothetical protein
MSKAKRKVREILRRLIEKFAKRGPQTNETYGWYEVLQVGPLLWMHGQDAGGQDPVEHWEIGLFDWCLYWSEEFAT